MTKKSELRSEIEQLRRHNRQLQADRVARAVRRDTEFEEALQSAIGSPCRSVRVIMPNGTIISAVITDLQIEQDAVNVSAGFDPGAILPGRRTVTVVLAPQPAS